MPFSWWWPFIRPAPFPPLPFSPAPFFPFFPPWNRTVYAVTEPAKHTEYTYNWEFQKKNNTQTSEDTVSFPHLSFRCSCTPAIEVFREVCVWWEAGVCVPVEHQRKSFRENSDEPSLGLWNSWRSNHLLREGELGWYFWCCYHFCNIFWITSTKDWRVIFKQYQTGGLACDLKFGRAFFLDLHASHNINNKHKHTHTHTYNSAATEEIVNGSISMREKKCFTW